MKKNIYDLILYPLENIIDAIAVKRTAKTRDIIIENVIEISLIPSIEYRSPLIIQYSGFISAINAHDLGSISIDQKTPPSIESGINTKVPHTPTESHVFAIMPTITPIAPNAQDITINKNNDSI